MRYLRKAATVLCGLVFLASAVAKLLSIQSFELYVFSLGLASFDLTSIAARLLILLEGLTGLWFLSGWQLKWARWIAWAQLLAFSAFLGWRMAVGDSGSCHCFGDLVDLNPLQSLVKNAALALLVGASARELYKTPLQPFYLAVLAGASAVALFVFSPPDWYYRHTQQEVQYILPEKWEALMQEHPVEGETVVCFMSTRCEYCRDCARKLQTMLSRHGAAPEQVQFFFLQVSDTTAAEVPAFFQQNMDAHAYPFQVLDPLTFLPVTGGAMPVMSLSRDGAMVKEYDYQTLDEQELAHFLLPRN